VPSYRATVDTDAPPQDIHPLVADPARHPEWADDPLEVEVLGDGRYRTSAVSRGRTIEAAVHLVEVTASQVLLDVEDGTGRWRHTFTITPTATGSRVGRHISGQLSLAQSLLYWLVLVPIKRPSNRRSLERLARLAEGR
jgi:hypothetical protein